MKTLKFIFVVLLIVLLPFSCVKKGANFCAQGIVYDPYTNEPVEGVKISLVKQSALGGDILSSGNKVVKEVYSNQEGKYELSHLGNLLKGYYLLAESSDLSISRYDWVGVSGPTHSVKMGNEISLDLKITYQVPIYVKIKNVNCEGQSDTLFSERMYLIDGSIDSKQSFVDVGCVDKINDGSLKSGYYNFEFIVKRPSSTEVFDTTYFFHRNKINELFFNY